MPEHGAHGLQIFATDLSADAIAGAPGHYPATIAGDLRRSGWPVSSSKKSVVTGSARKSGKWWCSLQENLIMDPPFTKLDILSCRNLLIYLAPELQKKLIPLFNYSLNSGGILFLGSARDHWPVHRGLFAPLDARR